MQLGKLQKIELREVWASEASDFTPWLSNAENLSLLGETIGITLELDSTEKDVGPFRADILCRDVATSNWVLIENQLEKTDHTHLGQLITYASGLKAVTIIWIANKFTEEHRSALDWLNTVTESEINFFGLEVELWRIGESAVAPKFNIISKPNDWVKTVSKSTDQLDRELSPNRQIQVNFWEGFNSYCKENSNLLRPTKPLPQCWMNLSIGRSGFLLAAVASFSNSESRTMYEHEIRAEFCIAHQNSKEHYEILETQKAEIEKEFGEPLIWYSAEGVRNCRIYCRKQTDINDENKREENYSWLLGKLEKLHRVFSKRILEL